MVKIAYAILTTLIILVSCATVNETNNQTESSQRNIQTTEISKNTERHAVHVSERSITDIMSDAVAQAFRNVIKSSRIALVNFATGSPDMSDALLGTLEHILVGNGFIVLDRSELDRIRAEQAFQLSWEVDDQTALSIGRFIGAEVIVTGTIDALRQLRLRVLNTQTAPRYTGFL